MKKIIIALTALAAVSASAATLKLQVPTAQLSGTPVPIVLDNLDTYKGPQATIEVPDGVANVAKGKKVTSSDDFPMVGELTLITDGGKDGGEGCYVELMDGVQWELTIRFSNDNKTQTYHGDNAYPHNFNELLALLVVSLEDDDIEE